MRTRDGFIYYGKSPQTLNHQFPFPTMGTALFETEVMVDSARNANGVLVGQQIGEAIHKQNMVWERLEPEKWWRINRFIKENGFRFYVKYFNHTYGEMEIKEFYVGPRKANPVYINHKNLKPAFYENATMNVISTGKK